MDHLKKPDVPVLDVGCGTGDVGIALHKRGFPFVGIDPSREMLRLARQKFNLGQWVQADASHLPFKPASFGGVTSAFVLRNLPNRPSAFAELTRVLRSGGCVLHLELGKPSEGLSHAMHEFYIRLFIPAFGLLSRDRRSYRYLARTILEVPAPERFADEMVASGLKGARVERFAAGGLAIIEATKPPGART